MHAADGAFVSFAQLLRPQPVPATPDTDTAVQAAEPAPPPLDLSAFARDVRLFRARLADAFDASLAADVDALLAALLERLQ